MVAGIDVFLLAGVLRGVSKVWVLYLWDRRLYGIGYLLTVIIVPELNREFSHFR